MFYIDIIWKKMWNYRCIFIHIYTGEYNINNIYIVQILNTSISRSRNVASHKGDYIYIYQRYYKNMHATQSMLQTITRFFLPHNKLTLKF